LRDEALFEFPVLFPVSKEYCGEDGVDYDCVRHHLKTISTLEEGVAVIYDVAADFEVLCANCHRMIHRSDDPSKFNKFRGMVQSSKS